MKRYLVGCSFCTERMSRRHFDVVFGAEAFFLCTQCAKKMAKFIKENGHI